MSHSSYFKYRPDLLTLEGVGGGSRKSWKTHINVVRDLRYRNGSALFGEGGVQCFGEFGASRRARTMKIGRRIRELHELT